MQTDFQICFIQCEVHLATFTMHKRVTIAMTVLILLTGVKYFANWLNVNIYQSRTLRGEGKSVFLNGHWLHYHLTF